MSFEGFFYDRSGGRIYPSPKDSPGKYKRYAPLNREVKRSISQYDHSEALTVSTNLCCRIPALRAAIRDKNEWAFSNWLPVYTGEDEKWGEEAEEYLIHEVMPNVMLRELRQDLPWAMRVSGMGLDIHGDDLCIFTEDEQHNPKMDIIPAPRIGNGMSGGFSPTVLSDVNLMGIRADGMSIVADGAYKGLPIYNGIIRRNGIPVAFRVLGYNENGLAIFSDIPAGGAAHYACEMEFIGQGRGMPRPAASILHWLKIEEIDDQLLKALANAARHAVVRKLPPGKDASAALGNGIRETKHSFPKVDAEGNPILDQNGVAESVDKAVFSTYTEDGNVIYIASDEDLTGIPFDNPGKNTEAYAIRMLMGALSDLGWAYELLDSSSTGRAPTRLVTQKANNSISSRQSIQEIRSIRFFQHAIAKGMENGRISKNRNGVDPYKWGIGFPAALSVDQGNDVTAALNRLKMGLTSGRIESAKEGLIFKQILRDRKKEVSAIMAAAYGAVIEAKDKYGQTDFTFQQAMELFYQPNPNSAAQVKVMEPVEDPGQPNAPQPNQK